MSFVIVTAADDYYMPLALDFLRSVWLNPSSRSISACSMSA